MSASSSTNFFSSDGSSGFQLVPLGQQPPIPPIEFQRERELLKRLHRGRPVELTRDEVAYCEKHGYIKIMPDPIARLFAEIPALAKELCDLGGTGGDVQHWVGPLQKAFDLRWELELPARLRPAGFLRLGKMRCHRRNREDHYWIRIAQTNYRKNQQRFLEVWQEVGQARLSLLPYRNNFRSYVSIGVGRARITQAGVRRIKVLALEQFLFDDDL